MARCSQDPAPDNLRRDECPAAEERERRERRLMDVPLGVRLMVTFARDCSSPTTKHNIPDCCDASCTSATSPKSTHSRFTRNAGLSFNRGRLAVLQQIATAHHVAHEITERGTGQDSKRQWSNDVDGGKAQPCGEEAV